MKLTKIYKNQKGLSSIFSYIFYILIGLAILSIVLMQGNQIIKKNEERYAYEQTIENVNKIYETINNVSTTKGNVLIEKVYVPSEIEINCSDNKIYGKVEYSNNFKDENIEIQGINIYRKYNQIYFEKNINSPINLDCNTLILNKGNKNLEFNYKDYNISTSKINVDIKYVEFTK